jgi:hypothetical protein
MTALQLRDKKVAEMIAKFNQGLESSSDSEDWDSSTIPRSEAESNMKYYRE